MVNTDMSLSWFRFPSEIEPEGMISLQVVLGQIKENIPWMKYLFLFFCPIKLSVQNCRGTQEPFVVAFSLFLTLSPGR